MELFKEQQFDVGDFHETRPRPYKRLLPGDGLLRPVILRVPFALFPIVGTETKVNTKSNGEYLHYVGGTVRISALTLAAAAISIYMAC
ncbi:hypothetical protein AVEN_241863-1 [Araneus ventricosus]|uniref:Uncharacterized protein n=1 Tax=Araneus ventricosus TaxID=182803 RepID=A0A4Y2T6I8_ARAVE|nr:hypothetical protein AVEN_241863-1 [Araneus ventricosus]